MIQLDLATFESKVDKIDVDKLGTVQTDLNNLDYVVKNDVVKKPVNDQLVNAIQITYIRDLVKVKDIDHSVNITIKF